MVIKNLFCLKKIFYYLFLISILVNGILPVSIFSESKDKLESRFFKKENEISSNYILDTGDELFIEFYGLSFLTGNYIIDRNGIINFPEVGNIYVRGLIIDELNKVLLDEFSVVIINPEINTYQTKFRPVNVYLRGEVKSPGLYRFEDNDKNISNSNVSVESPSFSSLLENLNPSSKSITSNIGPKVFDILKLGKGITKYADLSNITIYRENSKTNGGGIIKANVNILQMIQTGDQSQNINIQDRDIIFVPRSKTLIKEQIMAINKSNINPDLMNVFINGNVQKAGVLSIPKDTSLYEAILSAGGQPSFNGNIEFIRFNEQGGSSKKILRYNLASAKGSKNNPYLMDGDIVVVRKNLLGKTNTVIKEFSSPILNVYGIYSIFD